VNCPKCLTTTVNLPFEADLTVDRCETCKGIWMDKGELARFANLKEDLPGLNFATGTPTPYSCPSCEDKQLKQPLYMVNYQDAINVELCQGCEGLWFDHKEIAGLQNHLKQLRIQAKLERTGKK
jgi:Zn-finger nucleic acid-binding protein